MSYKSKAEILYLIEKHNFSYFYQLKIYLKQNNKDLLEILTSDNDFLLIIREFMFKRRVFIDK